MTEILIAAIALAAGISIGFLLRSGRARREQQQACEKARQEGYAEGHAYAMQNTM